MKYFAFISRHEPTPAQEAKAKESGITLVHVGDLDAFSDLSETFDLLRKEGFSGVVCVHPVIALTAYTIYGLSVGVFENINRAKVGEVPRFEVGKFIVFE